MRALSLAALLVMAAGCMKTSSKQLASHAPADLPTVEYVRHSGEYTIRYRSVNSDALQTVRTAAGQKLKLAFITGDAVGFRTDPTGMFVAMLPYGQELPLDTIPADARQIVFATRVKERTQLARNAEAATKLTAAGALLTTAVVGEGMLNAEAANRDRENQHDYAHGGVKSERR